ncbi:MULTISPECIES: hypothetical protein [Streptomyces]|uniref:Uncharacterized protein n=1 Tax=Streptomyces venezuelae TaxID=54571 RepID=A0A5P2B9H9_STRVZ|nr:MULTISPECIES: hypothetical protein [Streptomyces]NDZ98531.1 hypothetical protein [Streptomyces sp. SID10116]MYY79743.1 hypothetical protein [Streptomyces sp. SID335]MYZ16553.1 hypothetical protein [Streptomyces sp. SID337]NDZ84520.1 hypothetical protein [Streptomyces sp. SID10115]NEB43483.1 hypothetical protein [Streptomyces sp. SID339]
MARYTVTRRGTSGPGAGGDYTYTARADSPEGAVTKTAAKAARLLHRLNRGGTELDPEPVNVTRIN